MVAKERGIDLKPTNLHSRICYCVRRGVASRALLTNSALVLAAALASGIVLAQQPVANLQLVRTIPIAGTHTKFDHLAIDVAGNRLFLADSGNHSIDVIDLAANKLQQSITGLTKPHGLAWVPGTDSLYVSDGALAELRVYKGTPLALAGAIKLSEDADDMTFDGASLRLYVGHGGGDAANPARIAIIDTVGFTLVGNVAVATHPEGLDVDSTGKRVFANIADKSEIAVIDATAKSVEANWKLSKAAENVPITFDSEHQLIYVACRNPGTLIALDASTGKEIASQPAGGKADDLFYDSVLHRIYLISGAGEVDIYQVNEGKSLRSLDVVHTVPGAKTALFVPAQRLLYVGVPATTDHPGEIRVYSTPANGGGE
jgi:DNA-binding beta-propeller fold protein YncE